MLIKTKKKWGTSLNTSFFSHLFLWNSREALVEVKEGKKLRKRGKEVKFQKSENKKKKKRENIEALYERLNICNSMSFPSLQLVFCPKKRVVIRRWNTNKANYTEQRRNESKVEFQNFLHPPYLATLLIIETVLWKILGK